MSTADHEQARTAGDEHREQRRDERDSRSGRLQHHIVPAADRSSGPAFPAAPVPRKKGDGDRHALGEAQRCVFISTDERPTEGNAPLAGVVDRFGRVPRVGEQFEDEGLRVTVLASDERVVRRIRVERPVPTPEELTS